MITKAELQGNNLDLRTILNMVNNLPNKGSGTGEDISEELTAQDALISEISLALDEVAVAQVDAVAAIEVTYPEGSACTCSCGDITLTAKNTNGRALFLVPEVGTWTVTATANDGSGNTASKSVEIIEEQFTSIKLLYQYSLVDGDSIDTSIFQTSTASVSAETDDAGNFIRVGYEGDSWIGRGTAYVIADLTNYNILHIEGCYHIFNNKGTNVAGVYVGTGLGTASSTVNFSSEHKETYTLDVSGCGANTYICIFGEAYNTSTEGWWALDAIIYNMWLE